MNYTSVSNVTVKFIGFFSVVGAGNVSLCPKGKKATGILAFLIFNSGKAVTRDRLIDLFWSDRGQKQGQDSLRQALRAIRISLGEHADTALSIDRSRVIFNPVLLETDLQQTTGESWPESSGMFLENLDFTSPVFDDWLLRTRREIRNQQVSNMERRLAKLDHEREQDEVLRCTKAVLALDPLNETAARMAMTLYAKQGHISHARRIYEMLVENLRADQLQVSNETRNLLKSLSAGQIQPEVSPKTSEATANAERGTPLVNVLMETPDTAFETSHEFELDFFDRLLTRLTQLPEIRVRTRSDAEERQGYTLVMSTGRRPTGFRVSLRLMAPDTQMIWSLREDLEDAPDDARIQVAVDTLIVQMLPALEEHVFHQISGEPVTAYGNFLFSKRIFSIAPSENYVEEVLRYLKRSIELDPEFLPPYSNLVMNYNTGMFMSQPGLDHSHHRDKAFQLSQRLLFLNSKHANAHISMGWCLLWRYKFDAAERSIRRAMDLSPHDPHKLNVVGTALVYLGHLDEGEQYYEMAQERLQHDFDFQRTDYGELYCLKGEYDAALSWMETPEVRTPYKTLFWRVLAFAQLGRIAEAKADTDAFVEDIRGRWKGPKPFLPEDGFQWYCDLLPLRRNVDRNLLLDSFEKVGVALKVRGIS